MKVQVVSYRNIGEYCWDWNNSPIGAKGIEGTLEVGRLDGDTWKRGPLPLDSKVSMVDGRHYIHVVIPQDLPEDCYVALVQNITPTVVALTPLHVPEVSLLKEWHTSHHKVE